MKKADITAVERCIVFLIGCVFRWQREWGAHCVRAVSAVLVRFGLGATNDSVAVGAVKRFHPLHSAGCDWSMNGVPPFPARDSGLFEKVARTE